MVDPVPAKIRSIWPPVIVGAVAVGFTIWAQQYGAIPRRLPTVVGVSMAALAVLDLLSRFDTRLAAWLRLVLGADFANREMKHDPAFPREAAMIGWMVAAIAAIWVLGLLPAIPIYIVAYMRLWGGRPWASSLISAAIVLAFVFIVFELLLDYPLYRGGVLEALS
jgi:hypothetical protein